jgi:hypothetical protein
MLSGGFARWLFAAGDERRRVACSSTRVAAPATPAQAARKTMMAAVLSKRRLSKDEEAIRKS